MHQVYRLVMRLGTALFLTTYNRPACFRFKLRFGFQARVCEKRKCDRISARRWTTVMVSDVQPLVEQPEGVEITPGVSKRHVSVEKY